MRRPTKECGCASAGMTRVTWQQHALYRVKPWLRPASSVKEAGMADVNAALPWLKSAHGPALGLANGVGVAWDPAAASSGAGLVDSATIGFDTGGVAGIVPTFEGAPFTRSVASALVACTGKDLLGWGVVPDSDYAYVILGGGDAFSLYVLGERRLKRPALCGRHLLTRIDGQLLSYQWYCSDDEETVYVDFRWKFDGYRALEGDGGMDWVFTVRMGAEMDVANSDEPPMPYFIGRAQITVPNPWVHVETNGTGSWDVEIPRIPLETASAVSTEQALGAFAFMLIRNCANHQKLTDCDATGFAGAPEASVSSVFGLIAEDQQDVTTGTDTAGLTTRGSSTAFDAIEATIAELFAQLRVECDDLLDPEDPGTPRIPDDLSP